MATWAELRARAASAAASAASAGSSLPEKRDDIETADNSELQTDRISECTGSSDSGSGKTEDKLMHEDNVDEMTGEDFNDDNNDMSNNENMVDESHFYDDDDSKIDINSVISGNIENDVDEDDGDDNRSNDIHTEVVFGKNLGEIFANAEGIARKSNQVLDDYEPRSGISNNNTQVTIKRANSSSNLHPCRPPLAPGRPATANASMRGVANNNNDDSNNNNLKRKATDQAPVLEGSTRLSVWLRVRPPVCSNGNKGVDGAVNTIEVLVDNNDMPTTIRTYPPPNSNASKVVRGGGGGVSSNNKLAIMSDALKKSATVSTKSLIDEGRDSDGGGSVDLTAEVRGVKEYSYSGVFGPNSTQSDVYNNVARPLVDGLFTQSTKNADDNVVSLGESALLFALGVTNGGKTHTVLGSGFEKNMGNSTNVPNNDWGIIHRSLDHIIARVNAINAEAKSGPRLQVYLSYLEIYNEGIYDLLPLKSDVPRRPCDGPLTLKLRESRHGRIFVRGLARHAVNNVQHGFELLKTAKNTRHTASNNINANSSRSHSICQLEIAFAPGGTTVDNSKGRSHAIADSECDTDDESVCSSKSSSHGQPSDNNHRQRKSSIIWIVDLAGSERSKRTHSHSIHQREAALINASLMNLMRCLREMLNHQPKKRGVANKGGVVPFRESKLTHMFMNHLTGPAASRTSMIVNVNPGADDYDETQHVLGYAATARNVTISAIDYNRQRQKFVKESAATSTSSPKKALTFAKKSGNRLAKIVSKLSPKKRKIVTAESSSDPETKRLRCNSDSDVEKSTTNPTIARGNNDQLQRLCEENLIIKSTVDDLRQQLTECENEVREEVVAMMSEQLQESKDWYENRIMQLKQQLAYVQSTMATARADGENSNSEITDLFERIDECEDEMKRMREDHIAEVELFNARFTQLKSDHQFAIDNRITEHKLELQLEQTKSKRLESELGALRHQSRELQFSHDNLLAKYNDLVESTGQCADKKLMEDINHEKENPSSSVASIQESSPSIRKLRREKVSGVASTATAVDNLSPKKKMTGWFGKSQLAAGELSPAESTGTNRSPMRSNIQ